MLLIPAEARDSAIHGTGVFCLTRISKGTDIWRFSADVDSAYEKNVAELLPEPHRTEVLSLHHSYISKKTGRYTFPGDVSKYMNHADKPNTGTRFDSSSDEDIGFALRDIEPGEELTIDYRGFAAEISSDCNFHSYA